MSGVSGMESAREKLIAPEIKLSIRFKQGSDGYVVAECPDVPGCVTQGKTREEALENLEDVIRTCLALIIRQWIGNAKKGSPQADEESEEDQMTIRFVLGEVAYL